MEYKSKIEDEILEGDIDLEKLIEKRKNVEKLEEEYLKSYNEKLVNINRQLDILLAKKLDLVTLKKNKIKKYEEQKEEINKKINELNENKETLKNIKQEKNIISFNKINEFLNNVVEKVKNVTYGYIFKKYENEEEGNEEKIENIKIMTKNAVEEINNLSKLVIKNINEEKKMNLKNNAGNLKKEGNSELCEKCEYKNKHKLDHLSIRVIAQDEETTYEGIQCKGCGATIWVGN